MNRKERHQVPRRLVLDVSIRRVAARAASGHVHVDTERHIFLHTRREEQARQLTLGRETAQQDSLHAVPLRQFVGGWRVGGLRNTGGLLQRFGAREKGGEERQTRARFGTEKHVIAFHEKGQHTTDNTQRHAADQRHHNKQDRVHERLNVARHVRGLLRRKRAADVAQGFGRLVLLPCRIVSHSIQRLERRDKHGEHRQRLLCIQQAQDARQQALALYMVQQRDKRMGVRHTQRLQHPQLLPQLLRQLFQLAVVRRRLTTQLLQPQREGVELLQNAQRLATRERFPRSILRLPSRIAQRRPFQCHTHGILVIGGLCRGRRCLVRLADQL